MKMRGAAIGTFDGVHLGHCSVLDVLSRLCEEKDLSPVAITFEKHPLAHIAPERCPVEITPLPQKKRLLGKYGVEPLVFTFDEEMRMTTAEEWMRKIYSELGVRLLVIGYDNTFGYDGINLSIADYRALGQKIGIEVVEAPELKDISSSAIRKAVIAGDMENAERMLGRPYSLSGVVVEGNQVGRTLGFPTANLNVPENSAVPAKGTYSGLVKLPDGKVYKAMVNIGTRPTLRRSDESVIEAHLIGFSGDLYGRQITLQFLKRLRDEIKFDTIEDLRKQITRDKEMIVNS